MSDVATRSAPRTGIRGLSAGAVLIAGVFVVPLALAVIFSSYSAPDAAAYVRMAFASVAGCTIAVITVFALLIHRIARRSSASTITYYAMIAIAVTLWQIQGVGSATEMLLTRLAFP